jgi:cinnamyl-alcohol dehydrogenase
MGTMDGIIDTVSATHPLLPFIGLLKSQGKLVMVGAPDKPPELPVFPLLLGKCLYDINNHLYDISVYLQLFML